MAVQSFIILLCVIFVEPAAIKGKAPLCRDPDTGKLYKVNATWPSTTFCGNYTCKQRKYNNTHNERVLIREFNVTPLINNQINDKTEPNIIKEKTSDEVTKSGVNIKEENNNENAKSEINILNKDNNDRYLTNKEIESLTNALKTVKKSDLEAIVDIYNLAQEVYNEMDAITDESSIRETVHELKQRHMNNKPVSYFYEPHKGHIDEDVIKTVKETLESTEYPVSPYNRISYVHQPRHNQAIHNTYLLPYPFTYVHHSNGSHPTNYFYNPWLFDYYKRRNYKSYLNALLSEIPKTVLVNTYLEEVRGDKPTETAEIVDHVVDDVSEWKTEPLSSQVLEEISANMPEIGYVKPYPFKKKVVLEKVTKVIKVNDLDRAKREVKEDEYETYIEKTTCATEIVPGFFRYGNMSQPYPECCPQLIRS